MLRTEDKQDREASGIHRLAQLFLEVYLDAWAAGPSTDAGYLAEFVDTWGAECRFYEDGLADAWMLCIYPAKNSTHARPRKYSKRTVLACIGFGQVGIYSWPCHRSARAPARAGGSCPLRRERLVALRSRRRFGLEDWRLDITGRYSGSAHQDRCGHGREAIQSPFRRRMQARPLISSARSRFLLAPSSALRCGQRAWNHDGPARVDQHALVGTP